MICVDGTVRLKRRLDVVLIKVRWILVNRIKENSLGRHHQDTLDNSACQAVQRVSKMNAKPAVIRQLHSRHLALAVLLLRSEVDLLALRSLLLAQHHLARLPICLLTVLFVSLVSTS